MKNKLLALLAAGCLSGTLLVFGACGGNSDALTSSSEDTASTVPTSSEVPDEYVAPEGYTMYADAYITFAYPSTWEKMELFGVVMLMDASEESAEAGGNNITLVSTDKTNEYENMTAESFLASMGPDLEESGMTASAVSVQQKSKNGTNVTVISYTLTMDMSDMFEEEAAGETDADETTITMAQTMYAVSSSNKTYLLTITEVTAVAGLADTVYDSLKLL